MNETLKIATIGLGPVGMILSVHLKEAGQTVALCETDKFKMNLIRREGIKLDGIIKKSFFFENTYTSIQDLKEFNPDIVITCVKSYHLSGVADSLYALGNEKLKIICAMNGLDVEEKLAERLGDSSIMRMVVNFAGNISSPNVVRVVFFNPPNYLASLDDSQTELVRKISDTLTSVNLDTTPVSSFDLLKRIWEKNILNASLSPLCAITKMTIQEAMSQEDTVELVEQTILEAVEVAQAEKIIFEDDFVRKCLRYLKKAGNHLPSLAVDVINNRPTEIDCMNGKIVEYGRKHYIRTPINLLLTNVIRGITSHSASKILGINNGLSKSSSLKLSLKANSKPSGKCFVGVDLGSTYTKIVIIDEEEKMVFKTNLKTVNRDKVGIRQIIETIFDEFPVAHTCATGYGRKQFGESDSVKTEINCATLGLSHIYPGEKNIIDIGGEDIKVIRCNTIGNVENFYLNTKCAAGTGAFLTEIAERVDVKPDDMSELAEKSSYDKELNSFCTVFAKTEVTNWIFEGMPISDICRGIYLSIANRIMKMKLDPTLPVYLIGGVAAHHPFLSKLLEKMLKQKVYIPEEPLFMVALGAALSGKHSYLNKSVIFTNQKNV